VNRVLFDPTVVEADYVSRGAPKADITQELCLPHCGLRVQIEDLEDVVLAITAVVKAINHAEVAVR
jgi:hypothetical protein